MSKLKLDLDGLHIESFTTDASRHERGTVRGHDASRRADGCGSIWTDGCTLYCGTTNSPATNTCDTDTDTQPDPYSNNCTTLIEN